MSDDAWIVLVISLIVFFIYGCCKNLKIQNLLKEHSELSLSYSNLLKKYKEILLKLKAKEEDLNKNIKQSRRKEMELNLNLIEKEKECSLLIDEVNSYKKILEEESPLSKISSLYADFKTLHYDESAQYLIYKSHPAWKEAVRIKKLREETEEYIQQYKLMQYKYEFLLQVFPELENYIDSWEDLKKLVEYESVDSFNEDCDKVRNYISKEQYEKLEVEERNQLALDRYVNSSNKTDWQVGRDYEMYCAYLYRKNGWEVKEFGVQKKLGDMGRDLIAQKDGEILIVQCKRWSKDKTIHEKHLAQLYGTTIMYCIENNIPDEKWGNVYPVFISTTKLSDTALRFAKCLGIRVDIIKHNDNFPRIKCNISASGERIYHLPFDQQYDKTIIEPWKGEFYAKTVDEATKAGFRRAFRYRGN